MKKIFIDGKAGTTGLRIYERLGERDDIELLMLPEEDRKNPDCRKKMINEADIAFLCLPDDAAREAVALAEGSDTVIIDTSTAHRTSPGWTYAFPELSPVFADKLKFSKRIAVPGCHAGGFIALVYPLIESGILDKSVNLTCHSITGYSGGGKKMIADYESPEKPAELFAPREYGLSQNHKHLKEMKAICSLENNPIFCPIVSDFYSGMLVTVPLFASSLKRGATAEDIKNIYRERYAGKIVRYADFDESLLSAAKLSGKDSMRISVFGNDERILLTAVYDNLGKGASGAAVEAMNIILGEDETKGLVL